jgi:hypothetical protein
MNLTGIRPLKNDSTFELLPEGDYIFEVLIFCQRTAQRQREAASLRQSNSKDSPYLPRHGETTTIEHNLFLHSTTEGMLCAFFTAIGQRKRGQRIQMNWTRRTRRKRTMPRHDSPTGQAIMATRCNPIRFQNFMSRKNLSDAARCVYARTILMQGAMHLRPYQQEARCESKGGMVFGPFPHFTSTANRYRKTIVLRQNCRRYGCQPVRAC